MCPRPWPKSSSRYPESLEAVYRRRDGSNGGRQGPRHCERVESEISEGKGEKEAIALALDLSALVVLDDKRARSYARRVGLRLTGTLGVLLRLHRMGLASRTLEEDLRLLEEADMRITPELRRMVLAADPGKRGEDR